MIAYKEHFDRQAIIEKLTKAGYVETDWKNDQYWVLYSYDVNFGDIEVRSKLFDDNQRKELEVQVAHKLIEVCRLCDVPLQDFTAIQKS
ncbi:hypothetical protein [Mariniflexile sp. AS56]|uniref:hypothetical protein n=1 Tax=Mariniflexile sp. AS56 TaxID=3063957 RepID=UPI0026ED8D77|nr:hypothetical protein [Mariniflexile sp. AS56]MDO7173859.1 hypothetical protein [Mariniflexile sp. AS56]